MFFIYLGHYGVVTGNAYNWVFSFHVCLFFYLSGCLENFNHKTILENIQKKVINILIPFFFFAILGILYNAVLINTNVYIHENLMLLLKGDIRNHINFGGGLWFLSCLFVIEILFSFIKKMNKKIIIFITCLILFMFSQFLISPPPTVQPSWYWNIDSALYYTIFYCIGFITYEPVLKLLRSKKSLVKWISNIALLLCFIYSFSLFWQNNLLSKIIGLNDIIGKMFEIITPLPSIFLVLRVSYFLSGVEILERLGRASLYLCGNEFIIKELVPQILGIFNISITISTTIQAYIYCFWLLCLVEKLLMPSEKLIIEKLQNETSSLVKMLLQCK